MENKRPSGRLFFVYLDRKKTLKTGLMIDFSTPYSASYSAKMFL